MIRKIWAPIAALTLLPLSSNMAVSQSPEPVPVKIDDNAKTPDLNLDDPAILEGLKKIDGFSIEDYNAGKKDKAADKLVPNPEARFFAPLSNADLTERQKSNAKYRPFNGDILPKMNADVMTGALQHRQVVKLENGAEKVFVQTVGAVLPNGHYLYFDYGSHKEFGASWQVPTRAYAAQAVFTIPIERNEKPTGRYYVVMPMRDAGYDDICSIGAEYGAIAYKMSVQLSQNSPTPLNQKTRQANRLDRAVENYGDIIYIDPTKLDDVFKKTPLADMARPLVLTQAQKVTVGNQIYVVALGTEATELKGPYVMCLRQAVAAKDAIFLNHENKVPENKKSVSIGITNDGDATKLDGHVMLIDATQQKMR